MTDVVEGSAVVVSRSVAELLGSGAVEAGSVVVAARDSQVGWLVVEHSGAWTGAERRCVIVLPEDGRVVDAGPISEVQLVGDPIPTLDVMPQWARVIAESFLDAQRARVERDAAEAAVRNHMQRLEGIVDAAHEYADRNSLCEVFDNFMQDNGLRPRTRDWVCDVDVTVRVHIPISAPNSEAAEAMVDDDMVAEAVSQLTGLSLVAAMQGRHVIDTDPA